MLYICIPVHDEAPTIGVLLWRIRSALQDFSREYEIVVYDDGSTDVTPEVLEPYEKVVPLTVLRGSQRRGYAHAVDQLARYVASQTQYPRRDAMVLMQGDFTDRPEELPELVKRFEGGADVVVTERRFAESDPTPARRFGRVARWALRPFVRLDGVAELTSTYRLIRISAVRDLLRERGDRALIGEPDAAAANAELLIALQPHVRRVESVAVEPRYDARIRLSRIRPFTDAFALARFAWRARGSRDAAATRRAISPRVPVSAVEAPLSIEPVDVTAPALDGARSATRKPRERGDRAGRGDRSPRRERVPREERVRLAREPEREEPPTELAETTAPEAGVPSDGADASPRDSSRRRSRTRRRKRSADSASAAPNAATAELAETGVEAGREVDDGDPAPARRSRRGRKRRPASTEAGETSDVPESKASDAPSYDGDSADAGEPRARRSRRGRRRGRRPGSAPAGDESGSSPSSDAPSSAPDSSS